MSGSKSLQNREIAREEIYRCVNNHRRTGLKTAAALEQIAPYLGISRRQVHRLFFNEDPAPMGDEQRHKIVTGVLKAHLWLTQQLRDWADEIERDDARAAERERRIIWRDDTSRERPA